MNKRQRLILIAAAVVVICMLLYPPFNVSVRDIDQLQYAPLFNPPTFGRVEVGLLFAQWVAVAIVAGIAFVLLRDDPRAN